MIASDQFIVILLAPLAFKGRDAKLARRGGRPGAVCAPDGFREESLFFRAGPIPLSGSMHTKRVSSYVTLKSFPA